MSFSDDTTLSVDSEEDSYESSSGDEMDMVDQLILSDGYVIDYEDDTTEDSVESSDDDSDDDGDDDDTEEDAGVGRYKADSLGGGEDRVDFAFKRYSWCCPVL